MKPGICASQVHTGLQLGHSHDADELRAQLDEMKQVVQMAFDWVYFVSCN